MNEMVEVDNPFGVAPIAAQPQEVMATIGSAREVAEVQSAMVIARRFPRVEVEVVDRILQACTRQTLAEGALYEYARGGTDVRGPSIRLAEMLAQYWGHIHFGWRVIEERPGATKVETFCFDLQTGSRSTLTFDVVHERVARGEKKTLFDPRDIYEHVANAASRRLRRCILSVIPGDVVEAAVRQCEKTLVTKVEITPDRLKAIVDQFAEFGVPKASIEKRIQRRLETITPGMVVQLGKIYTSIRDGMSQADSWFDLGAPAAAAQAAPGAPQPQAGKPSATAAVKSRLAGRAKPPAQADQSPPTVPPQPLPLVPPGAPAAPQVSDALRDVVNFARAANTIEDVDRAASIATQLADPDEVALAQQHLDAARQRVSR